MPRLVLDEPILAPATKKPTLILDEEPIKKPTLIPDNEPEIRALTPEIKQQYPLELKTTPGGKIQEPSVAGKVTRSLLANAPIEVVKRAGTLQSLPEDQSYLKGAELYEKIKQQEPVVDQLGNLITAAIGVGGAAAPIQTAKAVAGFMATKEAAQRTALPLVKMGVEALSGDKVKYEVTELKDLVPEHLKDIADLSEFVLYGYGAKKFNDILKIPKVAAELAGARYGILKALGIEQETGLAPLTRDQMIKIYGVNYVEGKEAFNKAVEAEEATGEMAKAREIRRSGAATAPKGPIPGVPGIVEKPIPAETAGKPGETPVVEPIISRKSEDIIDYMKGLGEESDWTFDKVKEDKEYKIKILQIKDILENDKDVAESVKGELSEPFSKKNVDSPIVISSKGEVLDGTHRLQQKIKNGDTTIEAYVGQLSAKPTQNEHQDNLNSFIKEIDNLKGKKVTRTYAFKKFDNALKPIGEIEPKYAQNLGVEDNKVYSSLAYFIDHHFNNHPNTTNAEYSTLPEVLLNPDEVKKNNKRGAKGFIFIKKFDKYHVAVANVDIENGKIILHKTFFAQTKKPYKNFSLAELNVIGKAASSSLTKPQNEAPPVDDISGVPINKNIPQETKSVKREYSESKFSDEDKAIIDTIKKDIEFAQPGKKWVNQDEITGEVTAGYEPSDFSFIPYWFEGLAKKPILSIIDKITKGAKLTLKQDEDIRLLINNFKEIADEKSRVEKEGVSQSEIEEIEGATPEEVGDTQEPGAEPGRVESQEEVFPETKLDTNALYEKYYQEFLSKKYSVPEARRRAKAKLAESLKGEATPKPESQEKQQVIQEKGELFKGPGGGVQASYYGTNIDDFEAVGAEGSKEEFKLFEKVKALCQKYAARLGEKYTGRRAVGLFFPGTKNIFLRALNNMSVAIHEVTHYLDNKFKIVEPLKGVVGESVNGNPIYAKESLPMRKALTDVYEKYYPGGKRTHSLKKRLTEGIATFIQKYVEMPTIMTTDYPLLVKEFLSESGKYYDPILTDFIHDAKEIIREYQSLDALSKVKSRVVSAGQIFNVKTFLNLKEKIYTELCDNIFPLEKLGGDIHLWARLNNSLPGFIAKNIIGDNGYHTIKNGEFVKLYDFNWHTIVKKLHDSGETEDFGAWLFARDTHFNYVELSKILETFKQNIRIILAKEGKTLTEDQITARAQSQPEYREKALILDKNGITQEVAEKAYLDHKDRFSEEAKMFDDLVRARLDLLHDPDVGLVNHEKYTELTSKEGYASLKRDIYNEILGEPTEDIPVAKPKIGKNKISSMRSRHGSALSVINPLFNAIQNDSEITKKAVKQIIYNKIYAVREKFPGLFQQLPVETTTDKFGKIVFPQEKDPNIIMARVDYKRKPLLVSKEIKQVLDEVLVHQKLHLIEEILVRASRLFTKGTTGLYPQFAVSNFIVDQFTAAAQTKNDLIPAYTPLVELFKEVIDSDSPDAKYLKEYLLLGGDRQTLVGWLDMTPNEFFRAISQEKKGILKILEGLEGGAENILGFASKWSEIITRASEYIKARKSGKSQLEALEDAGQVTAPFHHIGRLGGGTMGKTAIKMLPFFSPAIQVLAQYGRTINNPKTRKRALFVVGILTAAMIGSMYWLRKKGTKKQKEAIKGIQPNELANYIWFPHPNGEDLLRFRISEQMGVFGTMANMMILDKMENAHYGADEYMDAATAWIPDQLNVTDPERLLVAWIPQLVRPALEVDINQRIYPKVTPLESSIMRELPPAERYTEKTSKIGRALGGKLGLSPIQWDHLIEGYLGRATRFAIGKEVGNPIVREIYTLSMRQVENYYEIKQKTEQQANLMKKDPKRFTPGERNKIRADYQKCQRIANYIRIYRDMFKKKNSGISLDTYRTKILDEIDSLY